jgi:hypothetical protein
MNDFSDALFALLAVSEQYFVLQNQNGRIILSELLSAVALDLTPYESLYRRFHSNPEPSRLEKPTSEITIVLSSKDSCLRDPYTHWRRQFCWNSAKQRRKAIPLRADIGVLPIRELTGLPYANCRSRDRIDNEPPVMHACGRDMNVSLVSMQPRYVCQLPACCSRNLAKIKTKWAGVLIVLS